MKGDDHQPERRADAEAAATTPEYVSVHDAACRFPVDEAPPVPSNDRHGSQPTGLPRPWRSPLEPGYQELRGAYHVFAHVTAQNAPLYRAVMDAFVRMRERFGVCLRARDVLGHVENTHVPATLESVDGALRQLHQWGNLSEHIDTSNVRTLEEFHKRSFLYQLTPEGEAAERALQVFHQGLGVTGELQVTALADIRVFLRSLVELAAADPLDDAKAWQTLDSLRTRFEQLAANAQAFMSSLHRASELNGVNLESLVEYKDILIEYLERFVGELAAAQDDISQVLEELDRDKVQRLLGAAARREVQDALVKSVEKEQEAFATWSTRWSGLRDWFITSSSGPAHADDLRGSARVAIATLLSAIQAHHERRLNRTDRVADYRALARWFAEATDDREAHRLWRAVFAMTPARHLQVTSESLAAEDQTPVRPEASWLHAPALVISPRLRATGHYTRRGRASSYIDRAEGKAFLREQAEQEARQLEEAQRRLASKGRVRLSQLVLDDVAELTLFLDLLGEALSSGGDGSHPVETSSSDGSLVVTLEPTRDGAWATIRTSEGLLHGPDHVVEIRFAVETRGGKREAA